MCWKLWESKRTHQGARHRNRKPSHGGAPPPDDSSQEASSSCTSGMFSSKDPFSTSSTTGSSVAKNMLAKDILKHGPLFYKRSEIAAATLNFSASQQIGSSAWKGMLRDSCVAIVRKPGVAKNFHKLLRSVHALHHSNLAKVMGGCPTADCIFVVYEFVDGIDLQACLYNALVPGYTVLSTWRSRMQVALDVAKGLEYAHQHTVSHLAHKYLTTSNVLLTKETLRAKLALVGMAALTGEVVVTEVIPHKEALSHTTLNKDVDAHKLQEGEVSDRKRKLEFARSVKIKGTQGYMPPEYLNSGAISQKYDVFTYGIVLLELLKGQEAGTHGGSGQKKKMYGALIVDEVRSLVENTNGMRGRLRLWMDLRLKDSYPVEDAVKVVFLALSCVNENPQKRPLMSEIALQMTFFLDSAETWERQRSTMTESGTLQGR